MSMRALLLALLIPFASQADPAHDPAGVVRFSGAEPCSLSAGSTDSLTVAFEINEGFHIQANPASDEFLIAANLRIEAHEALQASVPRYPAPERHALEGTDMVLKTYSGSIAIPVVLRAEPGAEPGLYSLDGELNYQACDARRCLAPRSIPLTLQVVVARAEGP